MAGRPYIVTKGIVLRETETKETDKILTLLTAERGKISVIARGARRKGCRFAASAQPLVYSEWTLYLLCKPENNIHKYCYNKRYAH